MAKFVLTSSSLRALDGGPSNGVLQIGAQLASRGHEVHVVTQHTRGELLHPARAEAELNGARLHLVEVRRRSRFRFSVRQLWRTILVARGSDVVSAHGFYQFPCIVAYLAATLHRAQLVVQPHGVFEPYQERRGSRFKPLFKRLIGTRILNSCTLFLASDQELRGVRTSLGDKIARHSLITGIGVRPDQANPDEGIDGNTSERYSSGRVLFVSRLAPKKRLDLLIDAMRIVHEVDGSVVLDVCGDGSAAYVAKLQKSAAGLPVRFHGHTLDEELAYYFRTSALFCLPSENENYGQVVAEAMAMALPVVTTANVGASEHVARSGAGWILEACDAASLASTILRALRSPSELEKIGRMAESYASESLTWPKVAESWEKVAESGWISGRSNSRSRRC